MYKQVPITIDEWKSGINFEFLGITLHFYNNTFELENHIWGSKNQKEVSYTGKVSYDFLINVLKTYGIENRIKSITRDNATPMTLSVMMNKYKKWTRSQDVEFDDEIDAWVM